MWYTVALAWLKKLAWPVAALLALLSVFASRRTKTPSSTERARDELQDALLGGIDERKRREEAVADAILEKKRSQSRADRIAGALRRASERLGRRSD